MKNKLADLITDIEFEKIEMSLKEPNIFKALAVERMELKHSNFIAYLLNPNSNHGINDIFIKKFLRDIFSDSKADERSIFDVDSINLNSIEIRREWRNIDILIILNDDIIVIENKVDTMDHSNQLKRYKKIVDENFQKLKKHYVFLTPFGYEPDNEESRVIYINYSYYQISIILASILEIYKNNLSSKVINYIVDYKKIIDMELLMNDNLNEIALKLYNAHKDALDFIFENRPDPASILYPYFEKELIRRGYKISSKNKGYIKFTSEKLNQNIPKTGQGWSNKEAFLFEIDFFWSGKDSIFKAVISPCDEITKKKLLNSVERCDFYKKPSGKKWLSVYTKRNPFIATDIVKEDDSEITKKVSSIINDAEPVIKAFIHELEKDF